MRDEQTTEVIFRKWKGELGDVIAIFPGVCGDNDPATCQMFEHVGQHGSGDPNVVIRYSTPATENEYADLKRELEAIPYEYKLQVIQRQRQRQRRRHYEQRRHELRRSREAVDV